MYLSFSHICTRVMVLDYDNFFSAQYFRTNGQNLTKLCICTAFDKIYDEIVICYFPQLYYGPWSYGP